MATAITIPDIGTTVDHVTLVDWLVKEGDSIKRGDPICEIETDKASNELESIAQGVVLKLVAEVGSEIEVGTTIAWVGKEGEAIPGEEAPEVDSAAEKEVPQEVAAGPSKAITQVPPMLRNLAQKEGVDLAKVTGSGPGGRITRDDILNAKKAPGQAAAADAPKASESNMALSINQQAVGKQVVRSHQEIPPINAQVAIDMSACLKRRESAAASGKKPTMDAMFIEALGKILPDFPHFRSKIDGTNRSESSAVNIGVAVSGEVDLFIPVVTDVGSRALDEIDEAVRAFGEKARKGSFSARDFGRASMSISNLGMYPVLNFAAIIPPGQAAALAIGATQETPVVRDGKVEIAPLCVATLSVDHRLINGREVGEFIKRLKEEMEKA
ncbi:MAG: dihydrolipoamide acetyltransferase family protein [Candidatus Sumerlaeia bacterium]